MKISSLFMIGISAGLWVACANPPESAPPAAATQVEEIPVTSKSPEAIELFKKGRALVENVRNAEAALELNHALSLDPDFVSARAYLGLATPGAEGLKLIEDASAKAANLPEAERLLIDATLAGRRGEFAKATAALVQLTEKVPNDWRAHAILGQQYANQLQHAEAVAALKKSTALNQSVGSVYNTLGTEPARERHRRRDRRLQAVRVARSERTQRTGLVGRGAACRWQVRRGGSRVRKSPGVVALLLQRLGRHGVYVVLPRRLEGRR